MKKILTLIILFFTLFIVTGCTKENTEPKEEVTPSKISIELKEGTSTSSKATFIVTNTTKLDYNYGPEFALEKYSNDLWVALPLQDEISYTTEVFAVKAKSTIELTLDWSMEYGKLEPGNYRLVKTFMNENERVSSKAEFKIK